MAWVRWLRSSTESTEKKALTVPHAFVNPFGFYVAGVVQELDSYEDSSLRDNARISYKRRWNSTPKSAVIKGAVADLGKPADKSRRLVNVIIADGLRREEAAGLISASAHRYRRISSCRCMSR